MVSWYSDGVNEADLAASTAAASTYLVDLAKGSATKVLNSDNQSDPSDVLLGWITWSADSTAFHCGSGRGKIPTTPVETLTLERDWSDANTRTSGP